MIYRRCGILLGIFILAAQAGVSEGIQKQPVDVYFLSGQSNMRGKGRVAELPAEEQQPVAGAWFWNGTAFEALDPASSPISEPQGCFGPELFFARTMTAASDRLVYLIKYWIGGRGLDQGWDGGDWKGDPPGPQRENFYPGLDQDDPNAGNHYVLMMKRANPALEWLKTQGIDYTVKGILWMQGERDGAHAVSAGRYAQSLKRLYERMQSDLHTGPVPFVYGQVLPYEPPAPTFTARDAVRASQASADHASGYPDAIPNGWIVSTDGVALESDNLHYNTAGQRALGKRFAQVMLLAQGKQ